MTSLAGIRPLIFAPRMARGPLDKTRAVDTTEAFRRNRLTALSPFNKAARAWNDAVADLVEQVGDELTTLAAQIHGPTWHEEVANAVRQMNEPLHSDVILSMREPRLRNDVLKGSVRVFGSTFLEQDMEFMPKPMKYPKFPYFTVEPATQESLARNGFCLLANPPGIDDGESNETGTPIDPKTYLKVPTVSVELDLAPLPSGERAAVLLNWSCKGRCGSLAKIFINGVQDVPAFEVMSTEDDEVPNFWTFVPWSTGKTVVDLKHVGEGYLWFEHVDVHHVRWTAA